MNESLAVSAFLDASVLASLKAVCDRFHARRSKSRAQNPAGDRVEFGH